MTRQDGHDDTLLQDALDGRLTGDERAAFERALADDPALAARFHELEDLQRQTASLALEPAPDALRDSILGALDDAGGPGTAGRDPALPDLFAIPGGDAPDSGATDRAPGPFLGLGYMRVAAGFIVLFFAARILMTEAGLGAEGGHFADRAPSSRAEAALEERLVEKRELMTLDRESGSSAAPGASVRPGGGVIGPARGGISESSDVEEEQWEGAGSTRRARKAAPPAIEGEEEELAAPVAADATVMRLTVVNRQNPVPEPWLRAQEGLVRNQALAFNDAINRQQSAGFVTANMIAPTEEAWQQVTLLSAKLDDEALASRGFAQFAMTCDLLAADSATTLGSPTASPAENDGERARSGATTGRAKADERKQREAEERGGRTPRTRGVPPATGTGWIGNPALFQRPDPPAGPLYRLLGEGAIARVDTLLEKEDWEGLNVRRVDPTATTTASRVAIEMQVRDAYRVIIVTGPTERLNALLGALEDLEKTHLSTVEIVRPPAREAKIPPRRPLDAFVLLVLEP